MSDLTYELLDKLTYRVCKKECGWVDWCPYGKDLPRSKDIVNAKINLV